MVNCVWHSARYGLAPLVAVLGRANFPFPQGRLGYSVTCQHAVTRRPRPVARCLYACNCKWNSLIVFTVSSGNHRCGTRPFLRSIDNDGAGRETLCRQHGLGYSGFQSRNPNSRRATRAVDGTRISFFGALAPPSRRLRCRGRRKCERSDDVELPFAARTAGRASA